MIGSWLGGPRSLAEASGIDLGYRGRRLGLPEQGRGSVASFGSRLGATFVDWMIAQVIARGLFHAEGHRLSLLTMGIFALMNVLLVSTVGSAIGGRLFRIRVARLDGRHLSPAAVLLRTALILLVIPALVWDRDTRAVHDKAINSVVVRR
jgi:uncharacterized RDD family membrane protein YckC